MDQSTLALTNVFSQTEVLAETVLEVIAMYKKTNDFPWNSIKTCKPKPEDLLIFLLQA